MGRTVTSDATAEVATIAPAGLPLGHDTVSWRVNSETGVFLGGGRALLMQVAHPAVGAGVEQHSSYASDPWGRFFRTVDIMMKLGFGTPETSERQQRVLRNMHRRVQGVTDDGTPYRALDPQLLLWVWATLVETSLMVYERLRRPLTAAEVEQFYAESCLVAQGCGVPAEVCPPGWGAFTEYVAGVIADDLRVTDSARAVATAAMVPPLPGPLGPVAGVPNRLVTVGLMPPSLRDDYGFEWSRADQRRLDRFFTAARAVSLASPGIVRRLPAHLTVRQERPMRVPWLQRRGAELTAARLAAAGHATPGRSRS